MTIDLMKITESVITLAEADARGMFDATEFDRKDWKPRAAARPTGDLYVYHYGETLLGWIDGEPAIFCTLAQWCEGRTGELAPAPALGESEPHPHEHAAIVLDFVATRLGYDGVANPSLEQMRGAVAALIEDIHDELGE